MFSKTLVVLFTILLAGRALARVPHSGSGGSDETCFCPDKKTTYLCNANYIRDPCAPPASDADDKKKCFCPDHVTTYDCHANYLIDPCKKHAPTEPTKPAEPVKDPQWDYTCYCPDKKTTYSCNARYSSDPCAIPTSTTSVEGTMTTMAA